MKGDFDQSTNKNQTRSNDTFCTDRMLPEKLLEYEQYNDMINNAQGK